MKRKFYSQMMVSLLMLAFLAASVGNVFGYAWCLGGDVHVAIDSLTEKGCCIDDCESDNASRYDVPASNQSSEHCRLCLDFSVQQGEAVFLKRLKRIPTVSNDTVTPKGFPLIAARRAMPVDGNLSAKLQPRISQTILAHRTVVLRN